MSRFKDSMIFMGWIAGLILIAALFWFLTQPVRSRFLLSAVNRALQQSGDTRRLGEPAAPGTAGEAPASLVMGSWFTMAGQEYSGRQVFVFALIAEGSFFPCAAVVDQGGKVLEFIALDNHGRRVMKRISPGILGIYTRRIEGMRS